MGVISHRDILRSKWITAQIIDSAKRLWYVPIKYVIGDYFLTELDRQLYCFKIDGSRIVTYTHKGIKAFRMLQYDTTHYKPMSAGDTKDLSDVLRKNNLPKVNYRLFSILKLLSNREKENFTPHELGKLLKEFSDQEKDYPEQVKNIKTYLDDLHTDKIITPVRPVVEFLEGDLLTTDPGFLGDVASALERVDYEHKKVTNTPITGKTPWLKIIAIVAIIGLVGGIGYWVYASGILAGGIPGMSFGKPTQQDIMSRYPTPEALKAAIDRGEINYNDLPPDVKKMVDSAKLPTVKPNP